MRSASVRLGGLSVLIVFNFAAVLFMNRPAWVVRQERALAARVSPLTAHRFQQAGWLLHQYAHVAGLDNRWQMFSHNSRFNWWYVIRGAYADGTTAVLPLPRQSARSFWQHMLFDFKEAKFHLNIYGNEPARAAYARYLCREYPQRGQAPISLIIWELHHQMILPPSETATRGAHVEPQSHSRVLGQFTCPSSVSP